jgi:DNA-binding NtrC family response regulator
MDDERFQALPEKLPTLEQVEREHIERVLLAVAGNKARAARILDIDRKTLHRKLADYARVPAGVPE